MIGTTDNARMTHTTINGQHTHRITFIAPAVHRWYYPTLDSDVSSCPSA